MAKLYEIAEQFKNLEALLEQDIPQEEILLALNTVQADLSNKFSEICKYIKNIENDNVGLASEVKRLSDKKKTNENKIEGMKAYMAEQLNVVGKQSISTPLFKIGMQKNPPSIKILDEAKIPMIYAVPQELKFDKKAMLADFKKGEIIEGCEIQQSESLRIK